MSISYHAGSSFSSSSSSFASSSSSSPSTSSSPIIPPTPSLFLNRMAEAVDTNSYSAATTTSTTPFTTSYPTINVTSRDLYTSDNPNSDLVQVLFQLIHYTNSSVSGLKNDSVSGNFNYVVLNGSVENATHVLRGSSGPGGPRNHKWGMLALTIIILCTTVGNLLVCLAVCWERRLQNMTNYFLMSLAIADFLVSLLVMPLGMIVAIYGYFPLNAELCVLWSTSDVLMCTASIWHMCTMSMDRFFTLKYPMRYGRNKTRRMVLGKILFVWIISIAISCPIGIMGLIDRTSVFNDGVCVPTVTNFIFYGSIFAFYIPLTIMLVTYVLTIKILWKNQQRMKNIERSELKPKLAQLTAQCTGFAVPKLLSNIRKSQKHKNKGNNLRLVRSCPAPMDPVSCSTDDRTALSSNYDPYEGQVPEPDVKVGSVNTTDTRGMTYLPLPNPHTYITPSSRSISPVSNSSCNEYLSSETEDSEVDAKYVGLFKSPSFRSLCSPANKTISETPSPPKRRPRKLSYKERQRRQQQQQQNQQQLYSKNKPGHNIKVSENFQQMTPLIAIDGLSTDSCLDQQCNSPGSEHSKLDQSGTNKKINNGCESHKGIGALVNSFSLLSSPLHFHWNSQRQSSCPNSPTRLFQFSPSKHSFSLSKVSLKNSSKSSSLFLLNSPSPCVPPELKIQQPSTDSSVVSQMDVSKNSNISNNSSLNQSDLKFEALPNFITSQTSSSREPHSQLEVPCPGYYRKLPVTRTTSGPILGGAVSDSLVCQRGLGAKTGEPGRRGLGSFPLSCGNLSKDYKSVEWDRRYFQIQEEMDELLRESFDRKATSEQGDRPHSDNISTSPDSPLTTPKSADYLTTGTGSKQLCFFRCHSMPNSPEKLKRRRKKIMVTKDSDSSSIDNDDDDSDNDGDDGDEGEDSGDNEEDDTSDNNLNDQIKDLFSDYEMDKDKLCVDEKSCEPDTENDPDIEMNTQFEDFYNQTVKPLPNNNNNDLIKICLHPPASDVSELDTSDGSEFYQSNQALKPSLASLNTLTAKSEKLSARTHCDSPNSSRLSVNTLNPSPSGQECSSLLQQASNTTSSSQLDGNVPSEADLTLDETDDTLEGDPSQDCFPSEELTENTQEDVQRHLAAESGHNSWFGVKKRQQNSSKKKRKYFKKSSTSSSSRNQNLSNTFRMRKLRNHALSGNGSHTRNNYSQLSVGIQDETHIQNTQNRVSIIPAKHVLSKKTASNEQKASKVLGIIFLVFVLLWSPFFIVNIVSSVCPQCLMNVTEDTMSLFVWMGYVASLANPIIYTMFNTAFRRTFVYILTCRLDPGHCLFTTSRGGGRDVRLRRRRGRIGGRPMPSYSTVVASDRRNTVTLVLRDESR